MATKKTKAKQAEEPKRKPEEMFAEVQSALSYAVKAVKAKADPMLVDFVCLAYSFSGFCSAVHVAEIAPKRSEAFAALRRVRRRSAENLDEWAKAVNAKRKTKEAKGD